MTNQNTPNIITTPLLIIGSGPAGLTAAIYAARARLNPIVIAGTIWGGQLMNTTEVENFPGFPEGIQGPELMQNMIKQAEKFGAILKYEQAEYIDFSGEEKIIKTDREEYKAKAVIISTGATPRLLEIPGEKEFYGRGVSTCATCDAAFFKEKVVAVIGGGDSAMEEANFLTRFAKKVYLIHRREEFRASKIMQERAQNNPKIEILLNTEVKEVIGDQTVKKIKIFNSAENQDTEIELDGIFLAIGHIPVTGFLKDKLSLNERGYIQAVDHVKSNIEGVFVAGDVEDEHYRQAITAAGMGCMASLAAQKYLEDKGVAFESAVNTY